MTDPDAELLAKIERYLQDHSMSPSAFGANMMGDPQFVFDLRNGRECRKATRERVLSKMRGEAAAKEPRARKNAA